MRITATAITVLWHDTINRMLRSGHGRPQRDGWWTLFPGSTKRCCGAVQESHAGICHKHAKARPYPWLECEWVPWAMFRFLDRLLVPVETVLVVKGRLGATRDGLLSGRKVEGSQGFLRPRGRGSLNRLESSFRGWFDVEMRDWILYSWLYVFVAVRLSFRIPRRWMETLISEEPDNRF